MRVTGASAIGGETLTDKLATTESPKLLGLFRGLVLDYDIFDASMLQRDLARVERTYYGSGFLDAHARAGRVITVSPGHVRVEVVVEEGPPTIGRGVRVDGLDALPKDVADAARDEASSALPAGARFDEAAYAKAKAAVLRALTDRGYAYAAVQADAQVDLGKHTVDYVFTARPGIAAVLGPITIVDTQPPSTGMESTPHKPLDERPLRRALDLKEGEDSTSTFALEDVDAGAARPRRPRDRADRGQARRTDVAGRAAHGQDRADQAARLPRGRRLRARRHQDRAASARRQARTTTSSGAFAA